MANASLYHDIRASKNGFPGLIKIRVYHNGKTFYLPTSISVTSDQWLDGVIVNHERAKMWNNFLKLRLLDIKSELIQLDVEGKINSMTAAELKKRLLLLCGAVEANEEPADLFMPIFLEYMEAQKNSGTKTIYKQTESRLC